MKLSTIKVKDETKKLLEIVKKYNSQSYDEVIRELVEDKLEEHLELKDEVKKQVLRSAEDIRLRRVKTLSFEELYEKLYGGKH